MEYEIVGGHRDGVRYVVVAQTVPPGGPDFDVHIPWASDFPPSFGQPIVLMIGQAENPQRGELERAARKAANDWLGSENSAPAFLAFRYLVVDANRERTDVTQNRTTLPDGRPAIRLEHWAELSAARDFASAARAQLGADGQVEIFDLTTGAPA